MAWAGWVLLLCPAAAIAQLSRGVPDVEVQEGLRRQEERNRQQQDQTRPQADVLQAPAVGRKSDVPDLPDETPCFEIREIQFEGKDWQRFPWLEQAAAPFIRSCAGVQGLSRIAARFDQKFVELGFATTRVSLPEQNLQTGILRVRVHVGRIASIRMIEAPGTQNAVVKADSRWGTWHNAFPAAAGEILNIRDLEQGVEQMKRLPSQAVATRLEPGAEPDSTAVVIERQTGSFVDRMRGGVALDNSGGSALGRTQLSGNAAFDNPLGLNDVAAVNFATNLEHPTASHRSQSLGLNYSLPWGYNTFTLSASHSRFAQYVQGTTVRFLSSGASEAATARLGRTVWRGSSGKLGFYGDLSVRRAESFIDDVELLVQRRRTTTFETGLSYKQLLERASLEVDLGYRRGVPWRRAQEDFASAAMGGVTLRPRTWTFATTYASGFALGQLPQVQYTSSLRGQHTRDTTLSIDQLAIGNRHSVRGFDGDAVLIAENGAIWRNDLSVPVTIADGVKTAVVLGIDWGRVWGPGAAALVGTRLAGLALGLRGSTPRFLFDLHLATPLYKPEGFNTKRWNLYAAVTYPF